MGSRINDKRRRVIEAMAQSGELTATRLRDEARDLAHPLHDDPRWLWDQDAEAAELYRLAYAGEVIRSVVTVLAHHSEPVRAFVSLSDERPGSYRYIVDVLGDEQLTAQMLSDARGEALAFVRKWQRLRRVSRMGDLLAAITELAGELQATTGAEG